MAPSHVQDYPPHVDTDSSLVNIQIKSRSYEDRIDRNERFYILLFYNAYANLVRLLQLIKLINVKMMMNERTRLRVIDIT